MAQANPSPQIKFESVVYDYKTIKEIDGEATAVFKFKNISTKPYIIKYISVSCGCTTPEYKKAPIMGGESSEIKVRYNPKDRPGLFSKKLYVVEGSGEFVNELEIKGEVEMRPKGIIDEYPILLNKGVRIESMLATYNKIPIGYIHNIMIGVYNSSDKEIELKSEVVKNDGRFVSYVTPAVLKPKEKGQIFVAYDLKKEPKKYGNFSTNIKLFINGSLYERELMINGISTPDFTSYTQQMIQNSPVGEFSSRFYHFGNVQNTAKLSRAFTLKNEGVNDLNILEISKSSDKIECVVPKRVVKSGETVNVTLTLLPSKGDKGRISETVLFVTDDQSQPLSELRLVANVE